MKPISWKKNSFAGRCNLERYVFKSDGERENDPHTKATEWPATVRGRTARHVRGIGPAQTLAAHLVAAVIVGLVLLARRAKAAAEVLATHLSLGLGSGMLLGTPIPAEASLAEEGARAAVERAVREAEAAGIRGPGTTPWLLARVGEITAGASVRANTALIVHDARTAG